MKLKITAATLGILLSTGAFAQHQPVFPALSGQELLDSLASAYKPFFMMPQAQSRDTLFGKIYNHDDSLTCVYTGFTIWLDPTQDPTQAAFMNGNSNAINTEHTYPQSWGASGLAEGDMHHLYPTRADVNAARANSPFAEIPDNETEDWYYLNQKTSNIPTSNINLYSERKGQLFEPREDHKGNVARAMFYFYTMYKEQADMANSTFFETQRQTLCAWHFLDPVDGPEWQRTWQIAQYQSTPNPYVLDCTLPERTFCSDFSETCVVATGEVLQIEDFVLDEISPNPMRESTNFTYIISKSCRVKLEIFDLTGKKIETVDLGLQPDGEHRFFWQKNEKTAPGIAFCRSIFEMENKVFLTTKKIIILP
jgi:hypothetical protein